MRSLPLVSLAPVLAAALALMFLPPSISAPLRGAVAAALAPGQRWAGGGRAWAERHWDAVRLRLATAEEQQAMSREISRLRERNEDLETALDLALAREESLKTDYAQSPAAAAPLVRAELVQARVLGPQARSFLQRRELLDVGGQAELAPGSLVFAGSPAVLDQGRNAGLQADDVALAGRRVAGKLIDVAAQTSSMQRVTELGYRDLVQLAHANGERLRLGAKGVLEGRGEPLCRIGLIEITEPVSAGDLVLAAGDGSSGAVYGRVARVERRASDAHWQIWMAPAVGRDLPDQVSVLRLRLNPERVAEAPNKRRAQ
jgi:cell shape-determining protein MreC